MLFTQPTPAFEAVHSVARSAFASTPVLGIVFISRADSLGTGFRMASLTDVRTTSGWLFVRRPLVFMAGRMKSLGTELHSSFMTMVRAASGWLSARPSSSFIWNSALGTARLSFHTDVRTTSGWLFVRRPLVFMAGCGIPSAVGILPRQPMADASLGVLWARPSNPFHRKNRRDALGTACPPGSHSGTPAASGWLSARVPADFSVSAGGDAYHLPVFPAETLAWMAPSAGQFIIDGTLGGGGHSRLFLEAGASVLGIDRDPEALAHARERLSSFGNRFSTWQGNFADLADAPEFSMGPKADGLLLDLGVSSHQLDSAERGFSFMREGPLDMRMGPSSRFSAADIVNTWPEAELVRILFEYGEEPKSRRIAAAIVKQRAAQPFATTLQLASCIENTVGRQGRTHPATRTFQAIRMAANEELQSLATALANVPRLLKPGGRLLIITFHSLEDRMVKHHLRKHSAQFIDDPAWPEQRPNPDRIFDLICRKAILPSNQETTTNPRARSAKLRVARLLEPTP